MTLQYCGGFCHTFTWISHGCTCVPHPELPSHLSPHLIPQGHPSAPALSTLSNTSNLDWWSISHMIIYMIQCYFLKSSHPHLLPQSPKVCSLHLCLFCCLTYRVILTVLSICKEIQPVHPKRDQSWVFIGGTDVEAETPVLWPPDAKS